MAKKKEGWATRSSLEEMLPQKSNKRLGKDVLDKLIIKHANDDTLIFYWRKSLDKKVYCFSPKFVAMWKTKVDKMDKQNRSFILGEEWLNFSEAAKLLLPIGGKRIPADKLEEIIRYFSARETYPDFFRPGYTAKKYPAYKAKLVEMVHRDAVSVLNTMIINYLKDHLKDLDQPHGVEHGRS